MERPNILLITTDTQRCDTLRCMGSPFARSPSLDRMAAEGVLFEQGHTSSPVCAPARCSLITGVHTPLHGCIENGIDRRTDLPLFPDALAAAGYRNIMVGKTHFGPTPPSFHVAHVLKGEKGMDSDDFYAEHIRRHGFKRSSAHPNPVPPELFMDAFLVDTTIREIEAAYCDAQVGRLLDFLDASGLRRSTLVIFSSDHGLQLFDHGFNDKHNYYDESWRVPFILSQPGTLPEGKRADFAIWNDITETILAAAGAGGEAPTPGAARAGAAATDAMPGVQGFDLYGPLARGEPSPRRCAVATLYRSAALATRRWKLEYYYDEGEGRLYDRIADPQEQNDLFAAASARDVRDALLQALLAWRGDIADVDHLVRHTHGGGPVATRIAAYTRAMRGADSERRLNERVERLAE